jgi:tetratricopeptide (TPR) repeat protein
MTRRPPATRVRRWHATLIVSVVLVGVAAAAFGGWWYARESPPHRGPILLISVSGLRIESLVAYGAAGGDMPAIDALASDSVVFERAYTHSPLTLPANVSLLAGQLPFEHGVRDEAGFALKDEARSVAELLRSRGFQTGAVVSSFVLRRESGLAQGFTFFDQGEPPAEAAGQWLRSQGGQRFFLFVQVGEKDADAAVRRVVEELKTGGLYDEATIVLTADGAEPGGIISLDDSSLQVPLIVRQPGGAGAGRRVVEPVQHIDILPTLLDLVRAPLPSGLRGRSLRPVLDDEDGVLGERPLYAESLAARFRLGGHPSFALTLGDYRYVRGSRDELLDLVQGTTFSPPAELPPASELRTSLERIVDAQTIDVPDEIPAAAEDEYAALGYLGGAAVAVAQTPALDRDDEAALLEAHRAAALLASQKKYRAAIESLRAISRSHPDLAVVHYQLGRLLARAGRFEEAEAAFGRTAALQPDNAYVRVAMASVALKAQQFDRARAHAATAVALAEHGTERARLAAHEIAARIGLAEGDVAAAETHAAAAQAVDPSSPLAAFVRGRLLYEEGSYDAALAAFEEAATAARDAARPFEELHWYLGDTLARLDRYAEAEMQFREELRAFPRSIRTYTSLAMLYRASNRDASVSGVLDELLEAAPTAEGYSTAARVWTVLGDRDRAAALRADARTRFRGDPSLALLERAR